MLNRRNLKFLSLGCVVVSIATFVLTDPLIGDGSPQEREWREKEDAALKAQSAATDDMQAHVSDRAYILRKTAEAEAAARDFDLYHSLIAAPLDKRYRLERFWYCVAACFGGASLLGAIILFVHKAAPKTEFNET
ncbi:MAG: hypothetical protein WCK27_28540 [Verrucomicrobiota bacterium]